MKRNTENPYTKITPALLELSELGKQSAAFNPELYATYDVKRGLRDLNGRGVLVGLTQISDVCSTRIDENGITVPAPGSLSYRGYNIKDIIAGIDPQSHFGFEECTYLLLFGKLPNKEELSKFVSMLSEYRSLPKRIWIWCFLSGRLWGINR